MSADPIIYCPERLTGYAHFERLATDLMAGTEFAGIEPLGGTGDGGRDALQRAPGRGNGQGIRLQREGRLGGETAGGLQTHREGGHQANEVVSCRRVRCLISEGAASGRARSGVPRSAPSPRYWPISRVNCARDNSVTFPRNRLSNPFEGLSSVAYRNRTSVTHTVQAHVAWDKTGS